MKIYFVTNNTYKSDELRDFLATHPSAASIEIVPIASELPEVLDCNIDRIVTHKTIEAYQRLGLPCVVEHSGLFMDALPGLPGGLGHIIWSSIGDRMCGFLREHDTRAATARSVIGYCDGRRITLFSGETRGRVAESAKGNYAFNWDPIFIPDGSTRTYGEMSVAEKRETSPAHRAWERLVVAVHSGNHRLTARV